jgi:hypothetical protein
MLDRLVTTLFVVCLVLLAVGILATNGIMFRVF